MLHSIYGLMKTQAIFIFIKKGEAPMKRFLDCTGNYHGIHQRTGIVCPPAGKTDIDCHWNFTGGR